MTHKGEEKTNCRGAEQFIQIQTGNEISWNRCWNTLEKGSRSQISFFPVIQDTLPLKTNQQSKQEKTTIILPIWWLILEMEQSFPVFESVSKRPLKNRLQKPLMTTHLVKVMNWEIICMPKQATDVGQFKTHFMGRLFHFKHSLPKIIGTLQFVMLISLISIIASMGSETPWDWRCVLSIRKMLFFCE